MQLTDASGQEYRVHFFHQPDPRPSKGRPPFGLIRSTWAALHAGPCAQKDRPCGTPGTVAGESRCRVDLEPFDRAVGRKQALGRAMAAAGLAKEVRAALWSDYLTQIATGAARGFPSDGRA